MRLEILILIVTAYFAANAYYEGRLTKILFSYKKYYQIATIIFMGFAAYLYMKKDPKNSHSMISSMQDYMRFMPVQSLSGFGNMIGGGSETDMLTPFLDFTLKNQGLEQSFIRPSNGVPTWGGGINPYDSMEGAGLSPGEKRILTSGNNSNKRSVSESKKKWVAANQNWCCGKCGKQLPAWFEVDHKRRLEYGGTNHVDNLVALCRECHGQKTMMENL